DLQVALEMATRLLQIAQSLNDSVMAAGAHFAIGCTLFHLGQMTQCRPHMHEALATNGSPQKGLHLTGFGPELGVFCLSYLSHVLWMLDEAEQSADYSRRALARAEQLAHPFSVALALDYASILHQLRNEPSIAAERAARAAVLCREYGFSYYLAWTAIFGG